MKPKKNKELEELKTKFKLLCSENEELRGYKHFVSHFIDILTKERPIDIHKKYRWLSNPARELIRDYIVWQYTPYIYNNKLDLPYGGDKLEELIDLRIGKPHNDYDYASTICLKLGSILNKNPEDTFKEMFKDKIESEEFDIEFKNGFVNFSLKKDYLIQKLVLTNEHLSSDLLGDKGI